MKVTRVGSWIWTPCNTLVTMGWFEKSVELQSNAAASGSLCERTRVGDGIFDNPWLRPSANPELVSAWEPILANGTTSPPISG
jgi:hypothetical protein